MPKEHAGGLDHGGLFRVPGEWCAEQRFAVKIEHFDFDSLDSIDDLIKEELALKGSVQGLFKKLVVLEVQKARSEAAVAILAKIIKAEDAGLAAVQLAFAAGMMVTAEKSGTDYAAEFGISKQAFEQGVKHYCESLGLRKTRTMRDEEARERMRVSNFRKRKLLSDGSIDA